MSDTNEPGSQKLDGRDADVPELVRMVFRGIGQVFFQENALTGALFALGIGLNAPLMAVGVIVGAAIGTATAWVLKYDRAELAAGIYGFNSALVGIATFFFFQPGVVSVGLLVAGCVVATAVTRLVRQYVSFPTYTSPFIVTTWVIYFVGMALGASPPAAGGAVSGNLAVAAVHGVGQVMFQASIVTGLLFLAGIAVSDWRHALWVLVGAVVGALVANYHVTAGLRALDPERLVDRALTENIALGLYGYNATLAAVALYLSRRSLIPPLLGILLSVPLTESFPMLGLPALTAPFVLSTWAVLALGRLETAFFGWRISDSS